MPLLLPYPIVSKPDKMWEGTAEGHEHQDAGMFRAVWETGYHGWS